MKLSYSHRIHSNEEKKLVYCVEHKTYTIVYLLVIRIVLNYHGFLYFSII